MIGKKTERTNKLLALYLLVMSFEYYIEYYSGSLGVSWALIIFRGLALLTVLFSVYSFVVNLSSCDNYYSLSLTLFFLLNLLFSFITITIPGFKASYNNSALIYFQVLLALGLWKTNIHSFEKPFLIICISGIVIVLVTFSANSIDLARALRRGYAWSNLFFLNSVFWAFTPIVLYSVIFNKYKWIAFTYGISAIIFNTLFLKRYILADSFLLFFIILMLLYFNRKIKLRLVIIGSLVIILLVFLLPYYQNSTIGFLFLSSVDRINQTNVGSFERFVELENYLSSASLSDVILGRGFCGTHQGLGVIAFALHVGWGNFLLKGGVLFLLLMLFPAIRAIVLFPRVGTFSKENQWFISYVVIETLRLIYTNKHSFSPDLFMFLYACVNVMVISNSNSNHIQKRGAWKR